jgi:riboflavin kinase/FMN adenylyltransferase
LIVIESLAGLGQLSGPLALCVGVFDGVHRGHRAVFDVLRSEAQKRGAVSLVVALDPHPLQVMRPEIAPPLLTTRLERIRLIERAALDALLVYPFDIQTARLSAVEFLTRVTPPAATLVVLVLGHDFRMGRDRSGGFPELRAAGEAAGFDVVRVGPQAVRGEIVSSSRIRELVAAGRVREAAELLGHRVVLAGRVVSGRGVGRTLEYPTANVDGEDRRKLLPKFGVYAVWARLLNGDEERDLPGVMNVGTRPTFGAAEPTVEVHLPDFRGDLVGKTLSLRIVDWIRPERTFESPEELARRIAQDVAEARRILADAGA